MGMKKIALILDRFNPSRGGAEAYIDRLGRFLVARGHDVCLLTGELEGFEPSFRAEIVPPGRGSRLRREKDFSRGVSTCCDREGFDVVLGVRHTPQATIYNPHGGLFTDALNRSAASSGGPGIARIKNAVRRLNPTIRYFLGVEERLAGGDAHFVAVSNLVARRLGEVHGVNHDRIHVIFNGVDLDRFRPMTEGEKRRVRRKEKIPDDGFVFLFMGHNFRLKGLSQAIRVLAEVRERGVDGRLVVCGRGKRTLVSSLIQRLELERYIQFVGETSCPWELYGAADVFLHPTYFDPCSLVVLEALAAGLPVVTTEWNGASELLLGVPGMVVADEPSRVEEMTEGVMALAQSREFWRQTSDLARTIAMRHPWEEKLVAMEKVLVEGRS